MRPFQQKSSDLLRLSLKRRGDAGIVAIKERKKVVTLFLIAFLVVLLACAGDFAENFAILGKQNEKKKNPGSGRKVTKINSPFRDVPINWSSIARICSEADILGRLFGKSFFFSFRIPAWQNLLTLFLYAAFLAQL